MFALDGKVYSPLWLCNDDSRTAVVHLPVTCTVEFSGRLRDTEGDTPSPESCAPIGYCVGRHRQTSCAPEKIKYPSLDPYCLFDLYSHSVVFGIDIMRS